jgi:hypothetical protein
MMAYKRKTGELRVKLRVAHAVMRKEARRQLCTKPGRQSASYACLHTPLLTTPCIIIEA